MYQHCFVLSICILIFTLALSACGGGEEATPTPVTRIVTPRPPVEVEVEDEFAVAAEEDAVTEPEPEAPTPTPTPDALDSGALRLWHAWHGADADALAEALRNFQNAYPGIQVESRFVAFADLPQEFRLAAAEGRGPDLVIAPVQWVASFSQHTVVAPLDALIATHDEALLDRYVSAALETLRQPDGLMGVPLSIEVLAMYYNRELVGDAGVPETLDELLAAAADGQQVAINTSFYFAFWGVPAFGGRLFDEQGQAVLDQSGAADYLAWLQTASAAPGMIVEDDYGRQLSLFKAQRVAYFLDGPWALTDLRSSLGAERLGVAPIPAGIEPAAPFLGVHALMISSAISPRQQRLALILADFLTTEETQTILWRMAGQLPANRHVELSNDPLAAGFLAQAATATPYPTRPEMDAVWGPGGDMIRKVLLGVAEPDDAVRAATERINELNQKP